MEETELKRIPRVGRREGEGRKSWLRVQVWDSDLGTEISVKPEPWGEQGGKEASHSGGYIS